MSDSSPLSSLPSSPEASSTSAVVGLHGRPQRNAARDVSNKVREQIASSDDEETSHANRDPPKVPSRGARQSTARNVEGLVSTLNTAHHRPAYGKAASRARRSLSGSTSLPRTLEESVVAEMSSPTAVPTDTSPRRSQLPKSVPFVSQPMTLFGSSPLASPTPSPPKTPSKRRASGPNVEATPSPSKRTRTSAAIPSVGSTSQTQRASVSPMKLKAVDDIWRREKLEGVIWVFLDNRGRAVEDADAGVGVYWWAAKLSCESWKTPLLLDIIGDDGFVPSRRITLTTPSEANIRPFKDPFTSLPRFNIETAGLSTSAADARRRKRQSKSAEDLERRWNSMLMMAQTTQDADDLPEVEDAFLAPVVSYRIFDPPDTPESSKSNTRKTSKRRVEIEAEDVPVQEEKWVDPGPDRSLEIPGELVLAIDRSTAYWPAMVHAYEPGTAAKGTGKYGKYRVEYLDRTFRSLKRGEFFTQDDDEFVTCKLGQFTHDDDNDTDDDTATQRPASPEKIPPPPTTLKNVQSLSIPELFRYTRNVLEWTIHSKYPPTFDRCESFYKGGRDRKNLAAFGTDMGRFESEERALIRKEVLRWALRSPAITLLQDDTAMAEVASVPSTELDTLVGSQPEREDRKEVAETETNEAQESVRSSEMVVDSAAAQASTHRPIGCEAYEALSEPERLQFAVDILVPEAALQLLAWQEGYRFNTPMLPPYSEIDGTLAADVAEQEDVLHRKAEQIASIPPPSEWVNKVVAIRSSRHAAMEARGMLREEPKAPTPRRSTGSSTRPNAGRKLE
ncbi:hypothetical protein CALCODRAFT_79187 [Calocera cornea HHB12733]|uniref:PWWP domain-containing protein n=1 Tax=Calocera cornea HHB12733 TaxID=1353952 RepID=A0A165DGG7_9BASI|nr:hypothetical protein CALCODRAFT_79187 [Calocera cornea HHB12733]